jgi:hypothetical protein
MASAHGCPGRRDEFHRLSYAAHGECALSLRGGGTFAGVDTAGICVGGFRQLIVVGHTLPHVW